MGGEGELSFYSVREYSGTSNKGTPKEDKPLNIKELLYKPQSL